MRFVYNLFASNAEHVVSAQSSAGEGVIVSYLTQWDQPAYQAQKLK